MEELAGALFFRLNRGTATSKKLHFLPNPGKGKQTLQMLRAGVGEGQQAPLRGEKVFGRYPSDSCIAVARRNARGG